MYAIKEKENLAFLSLECALPPPVAAAARSLQPCSSEEGERRTRVADVFDELRPPPSLKTLNILDCVGSRLPCWMWPTPPDLPLLRNVTWIALVNCIYCTELPPLGLLPYLKILWIKGASAVRSIGSELLMASTSVAPAAAAPVFFRRLEQLIISDMANLEKIHWGTDCGAAAFPRLEHLCIDGCLNLSSLTPGSWRGPKNMFIMYCPNLQQVGDMEALELIRLEDGQLDSLPRWLSQVFARPALNSGDDQRLAIIKVKLDLLKRILRQKQGLESVSSGGDWQTIEHIPRVSAIAMEDESASFSYFKCFPSFTTSIEIVQ